jgi:uncharacterized membrane protein
MRKLFLLVPVLLLAGCRGEQVAFQFQPAPAMSVPVAVVPAPASAQETTAAAALPTEILVASRPATAPSLAHQVRPRRLAAALKALPPSALATLVAPARASQQLTQHLGRRHATEGAAESGLGRVALFFIGVTLAVLAGLAALVNLIFSVGFFTALGYTAAGLVVLFILYSLLSGGKKKA